MIGKWTATALLGGALAAGAILGSAHAAGFVWNWTPSVPVGLWRSDVPQPVLKKGLVVRACLTGTPPIIRLRELGYFGGGGCDDGASSVLKPVAALPGDRVTIAAAGIAVNGQPIANTAQLERDSRGQHLPRVPAGSYTVRPGQVWLVSDYNGESLDSRYFGPVPMTDVIAVVHTVWVEAP